MILGLKPSIIDGDKYDFVEDEQSKIHVLQQIKEKLKEIEGENN